MYTNRIEDRWLAPLGQAALFFAQNPDDQSIAQQIMSHHTFAASDEGRRVRKQLAVVLSRDLGKLTPQQLEYFTNWIGDDDLKGSSVTWKQIVPVVVREPRSLGALKHATRSCLDSSLSTCGPCCSYSCLLTVCTPAAGPAPTPGMSTPGSGDLGAHFDPTGFPGISIVLSVWRADRERGSDPLRSLRVSDRRRGRGRRRDLRGRRPRPPRTSPSR